MKEENDLSTKAQKKIGRNFVIKDSGKRKQYPSGAVRDTNEGKIRWDLLPVEALKRVAEHYTKGAVKYGDNNWRKGITTERFIESACRHWAQYRLGETEEDHLSAVVFNILGIIFNEEKGINDQAIMESIKTWNRLDRTVGGTK